MDWPEAFALVGVMAACVVIVWIRERGCDCDDE